MQRTADGCRWEGDALILSVRLQPGASSEGVRDAGDGSLRIAVTKPAVDNQANEQLCRLLARATRTPVGRVSIVAGHKSRHKRVRIEQPGLLPDWLQAMLSAPGDPG